MLPDDDKQYAIETCRSSESVLKKWFKNKLHTISAFVGFVIKYWVYKMHGATIKITNQILFISIQSTDNMFLDSAVQQIWEYLNLSRHNYVKTLIYKP